MSLTARQMFVHGPALALLFVLAAFPSLYHGIDRPMLANVDMDLLSIYQAVSVLSGLPLDPNPHTGYFYNIALAGWLQLFAWLDLVPTVDMTALRTAPDFEVRLAALTTAGRWFSVVQAGILAGLVYAGALMLNGERRVALVLAIVFTIGGGGLAAQSVQMRTELPSMILIFAAALALIRAVRVSHGAALVWLAVAGACVHAAMTVKVQVVVLAVFLPLIPLVLAWRHRHAAAPTVDSRLAAGVLAAAVVLGGVAAIELLPALMRASAGTYQAALAVYAGVCAGLYGGWRLGAVWKGLAGLAAAALGYLAVFGLHAVVPDPWTNCVVFNFLEHGSEFSADPSVTTGPAAFAKGAPPIAPAASLATESRSVLVFISERLARLDYPFALFFGLTGLALAAHLRRFRDARFLEAAFLAGIAVFAIVAFWAARGTFIYFYTVYVEAWVVLAAAVLLRNAPGDEAPPAWRARRFTVPVLMVCALSIIGANVNFRLLDPAAATTRASWNTCVIIVWTPLFGDKFKTFCEAASKSHANLAVSYASQARVIDKMLNGPIDAGAYPSGLRMNVAPAVGECALYKPDSDR